MLGMGLPRAGQCRLTVLLAFTVISSTSSSVSPRITGGAAGGRGEQGEEQAACLGKAPEVGGGQGGDSSTWCQALAQGARCPLPCRPSPYPLHLRALMQLRNLGHREGWDLLKVKRLESGPLGI